MKQYRLYNASNQSVADQPDYIRCVHNEQRGLLISNPAQCMCEYCGQTWIYEKTPPVCPVLKTVYDKANEQINSLLLDAQEKQWANDRKSFYNHEIWTQKEIIKEFDKSWADLTNQKSKGK